jgi:hypothetical protein
MAAEAMRFPETVDEFMEQYKIVDTEQVYTNGTELVPIFRMQQWFEHLPAADVRPVVRGEWQEIPGLDDVPIKVYACSICRRAIRVPCSLCVQEIAPFCHCGADMRED